MAAVAPEPVLGLREQKKADKRRRIREAARELFTQQGFDNVTTAQLAARAEVGVGTLFRYVGSKAELLVALMNESLREGVEHGLKLADEGAEPVDAIMAMLAPLADECLAHYDNVMAYQREVLFGEGESRSEAITQLTGLEEVIAEILCRCEKTRRGSAVDAEDEVDVDAAGGAEVRDVEAAGAEGNEAEAKRLMLAHALAGTIHLDIVRAGLGSNEVAELPQKIREHVEFLL